jgi:hypothetical protein
MRIRRPYWLYPTLGLALYALLGFVLAPWLVERELKAVLAGRLGLQTEIGSLAINPFTFSLAVEALDVTESSGEPLFALDRLYINWELSSVLRRAWHFQTAHIDRPRMYLERYADGSTSVARLTSRWQDGAASEEPDEANGSPVPRLIVDDLRISDGSLGVTDRVPTEALETELGPIELHLVDFSTLPQASGTQQVSISHESGSRLAWTGALSVNPLAVSGRLTLQGTYTPLVFRYIRDQLRLPVTFDGGELDAGLTYSMTLDDDGELAVEISELDGTLTGLAVNQPVHPHLVEIGTFTVRGGALRWPDRYAHVDDLSFDQVAIDAYRNEQGAYLPIQSSSVPSAPAESDEPPTGWQLSAGTLRLSNWRIHHNDLRLDARTSLTDLNLTLTQLSNTPGAALPFELSGRLSAGGGIEASGTLHLLPELALSADLNAERLALSPLQPYLNDFARVNIDAGTLSLNGMLGVTDETGVGYDGNLSIDALEIRDQTKQQPLLSFTRLFLDRLQLTPNRLAISTLTLTEPYTRVEIDQQGSSNIQKLLIDQAPSDPQKERSPFHLEIGRMVVESGRADFSDLALPLPFAAQISNLSGGLTAFASTSSEPARLGIEGRVNEYGQVRISGSMLTPFSPTDASDVAVHFENVNLPRMSPYTVKFAGRQIDDGRIDLDLTYRFEQQALEGSNHMVIRDLQLGDRVEQPGAMDLPLDMAVALLKDNKGVIDLDFPVTGSLDDPEFSYAGAVGKAFANMVTGLVTAPFRLLGSLVGRSAQEMEQIRFPAGSSELDPPAMEALDQLAVALDQRPTLKLTLPPVIDPAADDLALRTVLVDSRIEQGLANAAETASDAVLLNDRRRALLEQLYDEAGILPSSRELAGAYERIDDEGDSALDVVAYNEQLRAALVDAASIAEEELLELAHQRTRTVIAQLTQRHDLTSRIATSELQEVASVEPETVVMQLSLSAGE